MVGLGLGLGLQKGPGQALYSLPAGFNKWTPDFNVYRRSNGTYTTDYGPSDDKPATTTTKYISPTGNNANSGDDRDNPYEDVDTAVSNGATQVIFLDGYYDRDVFPTTTGYNFTSSISLVAENPGKAFMGRSNSFASGSWTQEAGPNDSVWSVTRSNALLVIDDTYRNTDKLLPDGTGRLGVYSEQSSIANCQANAGSYFVSGTTVYVHTWDSRQPDTDIKITLAENNIAQTSEITLYVEGIVFYGEAPIRFTQTATNTARLVAVDCVFCFEDNGDALDINDVSDLRIIRCGAHNTGNDGFNYHVDSTHLTICKVLEVDCWSRDTGNTGSQSDNGTTIHDESAAIRLNGDYSDSYGPVIADVGGSHSINLNVTCSNSLADSDNSQDTGFQSATASNGNNKMWLQDCTTTGTMHYDRAQNTGGELTDLGGFSGVAGQDFGTIG